MTSTWRPAFAVKEAIAICGSLSKPGKMPCHGYALPATACRLGSILQHVPRAICHRCYALRGRYLFPKVQLAMARRLASLSDPHWVDAISTLIHFAGNRYFRWNDSGDLQGLEHLEKIVQVCRNLQVCQFFCVNGSGFVFGMGLQGKVPLPLPIAVEIAFMTLLSPGPASVPAREC